jgi:hypothetical protein
MDIFEQLEKLHNDLYCADIVLKDYQSKIRVLKNQIEALEMKAVEKLIEEKEQGSVGHIVGNTVYSYMRVNPKPIISDESKIPEKYFKIEKTIKKAEINQAIKDGDVIEGVTWDNGGYAITRKTNLKG